GLVVTPAPGIRQPRLSMALPSVTERNADPELPPSRPCTVITPRARVHFPTGRSIRRTRHHGPEYLAVLRRELARWLAEHEYASLREMRGSMSLRSCPDPQAYKRANYMLMLQTWKPGGGA